MSTEQGLAEVTRLLSEEKRRQLLSFGEFLLWQEERAAWQEFGRAQLAKAYGPDEPEYSIADVKAEEVA